MIRPATNCRETGCSTPQGVPERRCRDLAELERTVAAQAEQLQLQQDMLVAAERMAALGRVTAGIAHEINSPLGCVLNSLRSAKRYADEYRSSIDDHEITAADHHAIATDLLIEVELAETAAEKVVQFVRSIRAQTRGGNMPHLPFHPGAEIESTLRLLQHELRDAGVPTQAEVDSSVQLLGDPGQFGIVVQNLVKNAVEAQAGRPGQVRIRLEREGDALRLEVEDQGPGIPEELRERVFDFLFTTKVGQGGTGVGLAMVRDIVTGTFGGTIEIRSEAGVGTTFAVTIPLTPADA